MNSDNFHAADNTFHAPSPDEMRAANVNPATGLATDYLNLFNEYIMLAELVEEGSMPPDILQDWQPRDYEGHFVQTNFSGVKTVLAAYRCLPDDAHHAFDNATGKLIDLILDHQAEILNAPTDLHPIREQRDIVAALITGPEAGADIDSEHKQAEIDALFD